MAAAPPGMPKRRNRVISDGDDSDCCSPQQQQRRRLAIADVDECAPGCGTAASPVAVAAASSPQRRAAFGAACSPQRRAAAAPLSSPSSSSSASGSSSSGAYHKAGARGVEPPLPVLPDRGLLLSQPRPAWSAALLSAESRAAERLSAGQSAADIESTVSISRHKASDLAPNRPPRSPTAQEQSDPNMAPRRGLLPEAAAMRVAPRGHRISRGAEAMDLKPRKPRARVLGALGENPRAAREAAIRKQQNALSGVPSVPKLQSAVVGAVRTPSISKKAHVSITTNPRTEFEMSKQAPTASLLKQAPTASLLKQAPTASVLKQAPTASVLKQAPAASARTTCAPTPCALTTCAPTACAPTAYAPTACAPTASERAAEVSTKQTRQAQLLGGSQAQLATARCPVVSSEVAAPPPKHPPPYPKPRFGLAATDPFLANILSKSRADAARTAAEKAAGEAGANAANAPVTLSQPLMASSKPPVLSSQPPVLSSREPAHDLARTAGKKNPQKAFLLSLPKCRTPTFAICPIFNSR